MAIPSMSPEIITKFSRILYLNLNAFFPFPIALLATYDYDDTEAFHLLALTHLMSLTEGPW
jgi:hypothetical protein